MLSSTASQTSFALASQTSSITLQLSLHFFFSSDVMCRKALSH
jgi:hypothetical protein